MATLRSRRSRPRKKTPIEKVVLYLNELGKGASARRRRALRRVKRAMRRLYGP